MDPDHVRVGPDAPLENYIVRSVRAHTNPRQLGARRIDLYRSIPERFRVDTAQGREDVAQALATLVEDEVVKTVEQDNTVYYRLVTEE